jgi:APA family basic amino acid/polyamine antiporter
MIPIAGSAYTYTYATMGELIAWIIGWDLILEYAFANMSVSSASPPTSSICSTGSASILDPKWLSPAYLPLGLQDLAGNDIYKSGWHAGFDIPAFLVVILLTVVLVRGIRESARTNNIMVLIKIAAILLFVFFGASFIHPANYHPFSPNGWTGVLAGGSIIFFTYIGFDSVSTASEECRNPRRDVPIGIIATLIVCTILYVGVAVVLTGIVPGNRSRATARQWSTRSSACLSCRADTGCILSGSACCSAPLVGMVSSILVFQLGQARIWFAMSRDRLLPTRSATSIRASAPPPSPPGSRASWSPSPPASSTSAPSPR